jgi:hypothetical protein
VPTPLFVSNEHGVPPTPWRNSNGSRRPKIGIRWLIRLPTPMTILTPYEAIAADSKLGPWPRRLGLSGWFVRARGWRRRASWRREARRLSSWHCSVGRLRARLIFCNAARSVAWNVTRARRHSFYLRLVNARRSSLWQRDAGFNGHLANTFRCPTVRSTISESDFDVAAISAKRRCSAKDHRISLPFIFFSSSTNHRLRSSY